MCGGARNKDPVSGVIGFQTGSLWRRGSQCSRGQPQDLLGSKYPAGRQASAIIPLLWRAQEQEGWLSKPAIEEVPRMLGMAPIRALEVATFYFWRSRPRTIRSNTPISRASFPRASTAVGR